MRQLDEGKYFIVTRNGTAVGTANLPLYTRNADDFLSVEQLLTIVGV